MTILYKKSKFNKEELEWAVMLIQSEYIKSKRDTPEKMSTLIANTFDVVCHQDDILLFFPKHDNHESNRIEAGHSLAVK